MMNTKICPEKQSLTILLSALFLFTIALPARSQAIKIEEAKLKGIPQKLRQSLRHRLGDFIEAQRGGDWVKVSALLGEFWNYSNGIRYTSEQKQCIIESLKSDPLIGFNLLSVSFSTEILSRPLSQKWWYLRGEGASRQNVRVIAYRNVGQWFFSPPDTLKPMVKFEDLMRDYSDYLKNDVQPDCPVRIIKLSVKMNPEYPSDRRVNFSVQNLTKLTVAGFGFTISKVNNSGSSSTNFPLNIAPQEIVVIPGQNSYPAYNYFCEGESHNKIFVNYVRFSDGTKWNLKP